LTPSLVERYSSGQKKSGLNFVCSIRKGEILVNQNFSSTLVFNSGLGVSVVNFPSSFVAAKPLGLGGEMNLLVGRLEKYKLKALVALLSLSVSACGGTFQAASAVALGRQELFRAQNQDALESFEVGAREDPGYSFGVDRPVGVFSYLGRAQYLNGQYTQARQSLERDLARDPGNSLSRLYLGLTLVRLNEREKGLYDIVWGLTGIRYYINYVTSNATDIRRFWDRHNQIREAIASAVKRAEPPNVDWNALIVFSERIALAWEQEPDFTRMSPEMTRPYNLNP
jgi:tetratricopeptide (TPR) repeat protein